MQSTGHTSTHDLSFVPMQGSVMTYAIAGQGLRGEARRSYRANGAGARPVGTSAVRLPSKDGQTVVLRRPVMARKMNSRITPPTNATRMLHKLSPVTPV